MIECTELIVCGGGLLERERDRVYIEGASYRCLNAPPLCTNEDDLLCCSATVGNLGERGEPDILT